MANRNILLERGGMDQKIGNGKDLDGEKDGKGKGKILWRNI
jgi:hypothetical protein